MKVNMPMFDIAFRILWTFFIPHVNCDFTQGKFSTLEVKQLH